ncbi:HSP70-domain-containing protein [Hysterangium stoloniferum]|nr:HSP70-domain-containing protein [Hysterangium stoloniferum]
MAVVGIDLGNLASKIGVARHRGIDIITNEVSNRATPSLVSFGIKQRSIGEAAKTQETSNFKNTVGSLKRLIGRTALDPEVSEIEKKFINATLVDANGTIGVKVSYLGEPTVFTATQLVSMYLGKLKDIASNELKQLVSDVVIAVPGWYTDIQRRAVIDAAQITGLNPLRIINDTTAVALGYGITKSDLPELDQSPRHVVFVDVGHSNYSVAVVAFSKGQLVVKSTAYDRHLGGRDIDYALVQHFAKEFKTKYKIDVMGNAKATFRLATQVERLKKILSANTEAPLSVESIMNDVDASSKLNREQMEGLISDLLNRIVGPLKQALQDAGLTSDQVDAIELVGGSTRVPAIRQGIQSVFPNKTLSTTLNQDEAVARGATFACAMLSPVFRVRDFAFHDITAYSITVHWDKLDYPTDEEETSLEVYPRGNATPSTKILSFARTGPFALQASYTNSSTLPGAINPWIANLHVKSVPENKTGGATIVKVKTRLNPNGLLNFESAYVEEEIVEKEEQAPMEVDDAANGDAEPAPKKKKKVIKRDVPLVTGNNSLEKSILETFTEKEGKMYASDKLVMETEDRKNALEEYVYDMRGKLEDRYAVYVQPQEKEKLLAALQDSESWLYTEEGEEATKSAYVTRLDALHALGDPIVTRWREAEDRPKATSQLRESINTFLAQATSGEERYAHLDEKDKESIIERAATTQKWLDDQVARQAERPKNVDPVLTSTEITKRREELVYFVTPIFSKPKPKPKVDTPPPPPPNGTQTPQEGQSETNGQESKQEPSEMDVD